MTATQTELFCYGIGGLLLIGGAVTLVVLPIASSASRAASCPEIKSPVEEPSGQHAITASTAPRSQASCYVETGQISTAELAVLLAASDGGEP